MARKPSSRSSRALPKLRHVGSGAKFDKVVAIGQAGRQSLRIIGGEWRGEKFHLLRSLAFGQPKTGCEKHYLIGFLAR